MHDRQTTIIEAALRRFGTFGVKKTTMSDIADEAGVSRQTVYNAFEGKDQLVYAVLKGHAFLIRQRISEGSQADDSLEDRLTVLYQELVAAHDAAMRASPHSDELMENWSNLPQDQQDDINGVYLGTIRGALTPFQDQIEARGFDLDSLSVFLKGNFAQIKRDVKTPEDVERLFRPLKMLILKAMGSRD